MAWSAVGLTSILAGIMDIGLRPFALGLFAALLIGGVSFSVISVLGWGLLEMMTSRKA